MNCDRENITDQQGKEEVWINSVGTIAYLYFLKLRELLYQPTQKNQFQIDQKATYKTENFKMFRRKCEIS